MYTQPLTIMILNTLRERHIREPIWYLESGCSRSMTGAKSYLQEYVKQPVIMEYLVNISKRRAFWSLNEDILKINYSDYQYVVSIKEDTVYLCLHSPKDTRKEEKINTPYTEDVNTRIEDIVM
ncbi:hypothetical protein Tco_1466988 [Tanacetum coccineum]